MCETEPRLRTPVPLQWRPGGRHRGSSSRRDVQAMMSACFSYNTQRSCLYTSFFSKYCSSTLSNIASMSVQEEFEQRIQCPDLVADVPDVHL